MTRKTTYLFVLVALISLTTSTGGLAENGNATCENASVSAQVLFLLQLQADIQGKLSGLDASVADAALRLSATGVDGEKARDVLKNLTGSSSGFVDAVTISPQGKIMAAEPSQYIAAEGSDISEQDHVQKLMKTKSPVLSDVFHSAEGFDAAALVYPIFSESGNFTGAVSATLKPGVFLGAIIAPKINGTPYSAWLMQRDGRILYDPDPSEIGRMLFEDPLYKDYPSLLELGETMVKERSGKGSYYFLREGLQGNVTKELYWTTVGLHGNEWRLAVVRALA